MAFTKEQKRQIEAAFNTWQDEYVNDPEAFESSFNTAKKHQEERAEGREPSYGSDCLALIEHYIEKQSDKVG